MKFFALLDENNKVINTSVANDDWQSENWLEFNTENPAFIGGDYVDHYFYPAQPYPSWTRNKGNWEAPVKMPSDGKLYFWNELAQEWEQLETAIDVND